MLAGISDNLFRCRVRAGAQGQGSGNVLTEDFVIDTDDGGLLNRRMLMQHCFNFHRRYVVAATDDQFF